ncbi:hypothetical protein DCS_06209 [Drechmeria coniospora]|uniref:Secreted protein n=1 Tax=Drechmeria coniospora TaxID=98403 RepID=A0A151GAY2_DRECN|nr:hypothetical protein DCS_06209 [Drechmeria coniospora]KYK54252.1 hypothetical protein DCS_06209 [Drechmeria coniospora]
MRPFPLVLFAATALAHPASDVVKNLNLPASCPTLKTAAKVAEYRQYFDSTLLPRLRECVPSHGLYKPFQGISDLGFQSRFKKTDYGCAPIVQNYGCGHGFHCQYQKKCVRELDCAGQDATKCFMEKCDEHTREMRCVIKKKPPPGIVHEIDYLDIMVQIGQIPAMGALTVELMVDGVFHTLPLFNDLKARGSAHVTLDFQQLFGRKTIPLESLDDIRLVFNGQQDLTFTALAFCNLKFEVQNVRIMVREVASGLFFQANPIYVEPDTGRPNWKVAGSCRAKDEAILDTGISFFDFESKTAGFSESSEMKECEVRCLLAVQELARMPDGEGC